MKGRGKKEDEEEKGQYGPDGKPQFSRAEKEKQRQQHKGQVATEQGKGDGEEEGCRAKGEDCQFETRVETVEEAVAGEIAAVYHSFPSVIERLREAKSSPSRRS
jgi:hypothetical protein